MFDRDKFLRLSSLNQLETAKLSFRREFVASRKSRYHTYWYDGFMNNVFGEKYPVGMEHLVSLSKKDIYDVFEPLARSKSLKEIFESEFESNQILYQTTLDAEQEFCVVDPCTYRSNISQKKRIPAGIWELTFKGAMTPGHILTSYNIMNDYLPDAHQLTETIEGWSADKWYPTVTNFWILKPGAVFDHRADEEDFRADIDSGLIGFMPVKKPKNSKAECDKAFNQTSPKEPIYEGGGGLFASSAMGDISAPVYKAFDENHEHIGYYVEIIGAPDPHDKLERQSYVSEMTERAEELEKQFATNNLRINRNFDDSYDIRGTFEGYLFRLVHASRSWTLDVGEVDHEYRKRTALNASTFPLTKMGQPYEIQWDDSLPDRRIYSAKSNDDQSHIWDWPIILPVMIEALTPVPKSAQLFAS